MTRIKCDFPPCDNTATKHVVATCECGAHVWDARICDTHAPECEAAARTMLEETHTVTVKPLTLGLVS